jgi:hypothetical protein
MPPSGWCRRGGIGADRIGRSAPIGFAVVLSTKAEAAGGGGAQRQPLRERSCGLPQQLLPVRLFRGNYILLGAVICWLRR